MPKEHWELHGTRVLEMLPPAPRANGTRLLPFLLLMNLCQKLKIGHGTKLANTKNQGFSSPCPPELIIKHHWLGHVQSGLPGPEIDLLVECDIFFLAFKDF